MKNVIAVDLSLRSTGITYFRNGKLTKYTIIDFKPPCNDETLLIANSEAIADFVEECAKTGIDIMAFERFSFGASSGEKDLIYSNYWMTRVELFRRGLSLSFPITDISVNTWRSPLFNKAERTELKEAAARYKNEKIPTKGLKGTARKEALAKNKDLATASCIKTATVKKLPDNIREEFEEFIRKTKRSDTQIFDLTDSFFLGVYMLGR